MINENKVYQLIAGASNIIIMAHKTLDLDALGSSLGMYYVCSHLNKDTYVFIDDTEFEEGVQRALYKIKDLNYKINIINSKKASDIIDKKTLLIVVDISRKELLQSPSIADSIKNKMILDHHVKKANFVDEYQYEYINVEESSATEIAMKIIDSFNVYIPSYIATIMLSGIVIDTDEFNLNTTEKTFEAAALLKRFGADSIELQYLLKQDFDEYTERQKIIMNTEIVNRNMAVAVGDEDTIYERSELAKTADTILTFNNIEASFVIGRTGKNEVNISARSLGKVNVEILMKELNGGGHETDAATQIKDVSLEEVKNMLIKLISKR